MVTGCVPGSGGSGLDRDEEAEKVFIYSDS